MVVGKASIAQHAFRQKNGERVMRQAIERYCSHAQRSKNNELRSTISLPQHLDEWKKSQRSTMGSRVGDLGGALVVRLCSGRDATHDQHKGSQLFGCDARQKGINARESALRRQSWHRGVKGHPVLSNAMGQRPKDSLHAGKRNERCERS